LPFFWEFAGELKEFPVPDFLRDLAWRRFVRLVLNVECCASRAEGLLEAR